MDNNFNSILKRIRKEKGITQEQLADKVGYLRRQCQSRRFQAIPTLSLCL